MILNKYFQPHAKHRGKKAQTFNKQKIDGCSKMTAFMLFIPKDPQSLCSMK